MEESGSVDSEDESVVGECYDCEDEEDHHGTQTS